MRDTKPTKVNSDPRVQQAIDALGRIDEGEYVLRADLVRGKTDGRLPQGWRSRAGLAKGSVIRVWRGVREGAEWSIEFRLEGTYGIDETALELWVPPGGRRARVLRCPEVRECVDDVEWALTLLTSIVPRVGGRGLLSRVSVSAPPHIWRDVLARLVDEGALTEAQVRGAYESECSDQELA